MTTDWKSTIHHAYTTPNLLHPTLQKSIPNLIRDEISKLANLKLFQTNIQASSSHSQIPVDMKFTDDSLNIRISKNAPWISLVPSTEPMSPEERAVDAVRRDVMEKIALLWGGISDNSSDESDSGHRSSSGSSTEGNTSNSRRTHSRRSQRAERNRGLNRGGGDPITISGDTIDFSTHTTNNYYGCTGSLPHSSHTYVREEVASKRDANTQTNFASTPPGTPPPAYQSSTEELHSSDDSRSPDFSSDESKGSFTSFCDKSKTGKKIPSDISDTESESSYYPESSDESEYDSRSSFSIKSEVSDEPEFPKPDSAKIINATIHHLENIASDFERIILKEKIPTSPEDLDISESEDEMSSQSSSNQDIHDLMTFPNDEDREQVVDSTIRDLENIASDLECVISDDTKASSKRDKDTNTEDSVKRDTSSNTIPHHVKSTSTETDPDVAFEKTRIRVDQEVQTDKEASSKRDKDTNTEDSVKRDTSSNTVPHHVKSTSTETDLDVAFEKTRVNIDEEVQTDKEASSKRDKDTNTEDSVKRDTSSNTIPHHVKSTSTETDLDVAFEKTRIRVDQEVQTERDLSTEDSVYLCSESINSFEDVISLEDISKLNQFISASILETDAFIELANTDKDQLDPQLSSLILTNQSILQELHDIINSDPQLIIGSDKINTILNRLDLKALQLIHNDPTLEIPYLNEEDFSSVSSTLVNSTGTSIESEDLEDNYIDDEIENQPSPTYMQSGGSFSSEDLHDDLETLSDGVQSWINNPIYLASKNENETQSISTQTDMYTTENEAQLQKELRKLQEAFERTESTYKNELASLMRSQDHLTSTANEKIKQILQNSIQNEKDSFSRYQHLYEKCNKLLEDSTVEIEELKKALKDFEALDLTKKAEFHRLRNQFYSPVPTIISEKQKVETKTQSTQVEDIAKPTTSTTVESKPAKVKTNPPTVSKQKGSLHDRNLEAASLVMLWKEKAALEFAIQKNRSPKADLATKMNLLKRIDEELVRRNRSPQKSSTSTMTKEPKTKTPLTRNERDLKDLGKKPFKTLQTKLNDKRNNNK